MDNIETATVRASRDALDEASEATGESSRQYSPGEFLRRFGAVIAICLGLALLAHALVMVVGEY